MITCYHTVFEHITGQQVFRGKCMFYDRQDGNVNIVVLQQKFPLVLRDIILWVISSRVCVAGINPLYRFYTCDTDDERNHKTCTIMARYYASLCDALRTRTSTRCIGVHRYYYII